MACQVRQESDEMVCRCGLRWDRTDPDPPVCLDRRRYGPPAKTAPPVIGPEPAAPSLGAIIPVELPDQVARDMARAAGATVPMMRAAYRVFLDSLP